MTAYYEDGMSGLQSFKNFTEAFRLDLHQPLVIEAPGKTFRPEARTVIICDRPAGSGALWTCFRGMAHGPLSSTNIASLEIRFPTSEGREDSASVPPHSPLPAGNLVPVVLKFSSPTYLANHPIADGESTPEEVDRFLRYEEGLYRDWLNDLQGGSVPILYGQYTWPSPGEPDYHVMVMEDAGEDRDGKGDRDDDREYWTEFSDPELEAIGLAYQQLHEAGVAHRDVGPRHIRFRPCPSAASGVQAIILDFDNALVRTNEYLDATQNYEAKLVANSIAEARRMRTSGDAA